MKIGRVSYDENFEEELVKKALENEDETKIGEKLWKEFSYALISDGDWRISQLIQRYLDNEKSRPVIDQVFVDLCGWSLATLLNVASGFRDYSGEKLEGGD